MTGVDTSRRDQHRALALHSCTLAFKAKAGRLGLRDRLSLAERGLAWAHDHDGLRCAVLDFLDAVSVDGAHACAGAGLFLAALDVVMDDLGIDVTEAALLDADALTERYQLQRDVADWRDRKDAGLGT